MESRIEEYILKHSNDNQLIFHELRQIILNASPKINEKYAYQCPFYYFKRPLAYLYTTAKNPNNVILGFCQGAQLSNDQGLLVASDRKQIRHIVCGNYNEVPWNAIREIVNEAVLLQEFTSDK